VLTPTVTPAPATTAPVVPSAGEIARRIDVPTRLPHNIHGEAIRHLSHSSVMKFATCPEDWRRHYILRQRGAPTGAMFLGNRIDDVFTLYYQHQLDGETLDQAQLLDAYHANWNTKLQEQEHGVQWDTHLTGEEALAMGAAAVRQSYEELIPRIGRAVGVQRRFELRLTPQVEWTIVGYVDLDTIREQTTWVFASPDDSDEIVVQDTGDQVPEIDVPAYWVPGHLRPKPKRGKPPEETLRCPVTVFTDRCETRQITGIVDYKVKNQTTSAHKADRDMQATLYLAERWLHNTAVGDFRFAQVAKPGPRRQSMTTALIPTTRTPGEMRSVFMRIAMVASQINAAYNQFGPDRPWGFAEPGSWKCEPDHDAPRGVPARGRYCVHWPSCPMGRGL
jgi:PD-(D/E)XK nuclease superfamily